MGAQEKVIGLLWLALGAVLVGLIVCAPVMRASAQAATQVAEVL